MKSLDYKFNVVILVTAMSAAPATTMAADTASNFERFHIGAGGAVSKTDNYVRHDWGDSGADKLDIEVIDDDSSSESFFIQAGKDWKITDKITLGLALDYRTSNLEDTQREANNPLEKVSIEEDGVASLRARLGYLMTDNVLLYGTAGIAQTRGEVKHVNYSCNNPPCVGGINNQRGSKDFTVENYVVGLGAEWFTSFSDKLSFQVEGLYSFDYDREDYSDEDITLDTDPADYSEIDDSATLKFGVNYHF